MECKNVKQEGQKNSLVLAPSKYFICIGRFVLLSRVVQRIQKQKNDCDIYMLYTQPGQWGVRGET